jgi:ketosteroid isomerase-like protein
MTTAISHQTVRDYFKACVSRDPVRIAAMLDDEIEWSCTGPVDLLRYCGQRRGKQTVVDNIVRVGPSVIRLTGMDIEEIVIEGDRAVTFTRISAVHNSTGRTVSYQCAQFMRFRHGKLMEYRALVDSFDAAEQVLGHSIEVAPTQATRHNVFAV